MWYDRKLNLFLPSFPFYCILWSLTTNNIRKKRRKKKSTREFSNAIYFPLWHLTCWLRYEPLLYDLLLIELLRIAFSCQLPSLLFPEKKRTPNEWQKAIITTVYKYQYMFIMIKNQFLQIWNENKGESVRAKESNTLDHLFWFSSFKGTFDVKLLRIDFLLHLCWCTCNEIYIYISIYIGFHTPAPFQWAILIPFFIQWSTYSFLVRATHKGFFHVSFSRIRWICTFAYENRCNGCVCVCLCLCAHCA